MPIVHRGSGEDAVLADHVDVAESLPAKMRGLRFRRSLPDNSALLFPFDGVRRRDVDMLFVPFPIDVLWLIDGRVERASTLRPWVGVGIERADTVVELPAGAAEDVSTGDRVRVANVENSGV